LIGGQLISAGIGVACAQLVSDTAFASAYAVGGSVLAMLLLRCLHPPGAAAALAPVLGGNPIVTLGYGFVLMPVGLNVAVMLIMALVINRWLLRHEYPIGTRQTTVRKIINQHIRDEPAIYTGVSEQDVEQALQDMDTFMDVSSGDLSRLLADAQKHSFKRFSGHITCVDIMVSDVLAVEYGTEVEVAWNLMHHENLKALTVIDKSRRVIGIITWHDFFKFINVSADETFQEKFRAFIRRTPDISTDKPESVGHIMTTPVTVLPESTHIADLIPLMSNQGYRQIPIVNSENRLVGMVYQASLIAALYNERQELAKSQSIAVKD
jgi:CBS domain-containing membrane protein